MAGRGWTRRGGFQGWARLLPGLGAASRGGWGWACRELTRRRCRRPARASRGVWGWACREACRDKTEAERGFPRGLWPWRLPRAGRAGEPAAELSPAQRAATGTPARSRPTPEGERWFRGAIAAPDQRSCPSSAPRKVNVGSVLPEPDQTDAHGNCRRPRTTTAADRRFRPAMAAPSKRSRGPVAPAAPQRRERWFRGAGAGPKQRSPRHQRPHRRALVWSCHSRTEPTFTFDVTRLLLIRREVGAHQGSECRPNLPYRW